MKFALKKNVNKTNEPKKRKKVNEIKINITNDGFLKGKTLTKVFKVNSLEELIKQLNKIDSNMKVKLLINYNKNEFYIFKSEDIKKKSKSNLKEIEKNDNELNNEELATLLKAFYSNEEFQLDNIFLKKANKLKHEIAPTTFEVKENYLLSENKYINVISFEHLGKCIDIKNIIQNKDCWLIIDCYKVDNEYILNKIDEMKQDKVIEKKFSDFVSNKIDDVIQKLKFESIFQCEVKFLLYNSNLEQIKKENLVIREQLVECHYTSYMPQEAVNTRKLFEKCIYPNMNMNIIHSLSDKDLYKMIGSESYV